MHLSTTLALTIATAALAVAAPVPVVPPDPLPKGATARLGTPHFRGPHTRGLTFSADGKRLLAFSREQYGRDDKQSLIAWDAETGKPLASKLVVPAGLARSNIVNSALTRDRVIWLVLGQQALGPDQPGFPSEVIVTALDGRELNRFEVEGFPSFGVEEFRDGFGTTAVSFDSKYIVVALRERRGIVVYDLDTGARLLREVFEKDDQMGVSFAQDNKTVFVRRSGKPIRRYALPAGKELTPLEGTDDMVRQVAVSPDGKWLVTGKSYTLKMIDGKMQAEPVKVLEVRDAEKGKVVGHLDIGGVAQHFTFAGDDILLVRIYSVPSSAPTDATLAKWNVADRKRLWETNLAWGASHRLTVSPDHKWFAFHGARQVYLFDVANGKMVLEPSGHRGPVEWIAFSPDGKSVSTAGGTEVMTWEVGGRLKQRVAVPELRLVSLRFSRGAAGAKHLAWARYTDEKAPRPALYCWDGEKNTIGQKIAVDQPGGWVLTPDGKHVVWIRSDPAKQLETVTAYDGASGKVLHEWSYARQERVPPNAWGFSVAGGSRFIATRDGDAVQFRDVLTGKAVVEVKHTFGEPVPGTHPWPTYAVTADGARAAIIEGGKLTVYETRSGKLVAQHTFSEGVPSALTFSADGTQLAMWSLLRNQEGECVFVWDLSTPQAKPRKLVAERWSEPTCAAFSPNGTSLAVGYLDGTALVWDLTAK